MTAIKNRYHIICQDDLVETAMTRDEADRIAYAYFRDCGHALWYDSMARVGCVQQKTFHPGGTMAECRLE